jgi:hypothetical protein
MTSVLTGFASTIGKSLTDIINLMSSLILYLLLLKLSPYSKAIIISLSGIISAQILSIVERVFAGIETIKQEAHELFGIKPMAYFLISSILVTFTNAVATLVQLLTRSALVIVARFDPARTPSNQRSREF